MSAYDLALARLDADHRARLVGEACHLAILDDVHPERGGGAGIAPVHRVVACGAGARLDIGAEDLEARILIAQMRDAPAQGVAVPELPVDAVQPHDVVAPGHRVALAGRVHQVHMRALAEHHVVVQLVAEVLPQLERVLVELGIARDHVVRPHDGRVAPGIAAADPALLEHGDVPDAVFLCQVIGGGQPVPAAADHDHVIDGFRPRGGDRALPPVLAHQAGLQNLPGGIAPHARILSALASQIGACCSRAGRGSPSSSIRQSPPACAASFGT